ncbi:F0F1 ATP synthase subunit delta [Endobacter medicaginis]|uniref:F0F1 ATP synthase subunit delta n=1 Tax=Endobacter medicaginis TaxID=1181271 RepID=UPI00374493A7
MAPGGTEAAISTPTSTLDPASDGLAERYARALYALADERREVDAVADQIASLGRLIDESADLRRLLASPLVDIREGAKALDAVLAAQGFGKTVTDFAGVVAANRRLPELRRIVSAFAALLAARRGVVAADVTSAFPLTDLQRTQLRARLTEAGYSKVDLRETVDPALLGGLSLRIGARLYDATIRSRLQRLQHAMKGAA